MAIPIVALLSVALVAVSCAGNGAIAANADLPIATVAPTAPPTPPPTATAEPAPQTAQRSVEDRLATFPKPHYETLWVPRDADHEAAGIEIGAAISDDAIVMTMGYSNTYKVWRQYEILYETDFNLLNAAQGGREVDDWAYKPGPWIEANALLGALPRAATASPANERVEVLLYQIALATGTEPQIEFVREAITVSIDRAREEFPNLKMVYLVGRDYGGWATDLAEDGTAKAGEPGNWANGIAIDLAVQDNLDRPDGVWVGTGPYMWANGDERRDDGLTWSRDEYVDDGRHLNKEAARKVASLLHDFFAGDPTATWYSAEFMPPE